MNNLLADKVALVTGGTRGIGRAIVEGFLKAGAKVCFTYAGSHGIAQEMVAHYGEDRVLGLQADVSDFNKAQEVVQQCLEKWNGLHVLVNNAGITRDNLLLRMKESDWDVVIQTNLKGVFNYTKAAVTQMLRQRYGSIINISSIVGIDGNAGQANYAASKGGIIAFTKSIARELGSRNIRANVIAPGFIETEMTQSLPEKELQKWQETIALKRPGKPEEIANIALFLASDLSSYITGQVIIADGGM